MVKVGDEGVGPFVMKEVPMLSWMPKGREGSMRECHLGAMVGIVTV